MSKADDLYARVTAQIVEQIEAGAGTWEMPWRQLGRQDTSLTTGKPYRGINTLILGLTRFDRGYSSCQWGTFKAWAAKGHHVRRGQKGTQIFFWDTWTPKPAGPDDEPKSRLVAKTFFVFAREQIDDENDCPLPPLELPETDTPERVDRAEEYFAAIGADVRVGGDRAYYASVQDYIAIPALEQFTEAADYYSTLAHEHTHWTGHESRLKRELRNRFGSEAYAMEELVAELGAAFWCAQMGLSQAPRPDHSQYLSHWLQVLKTDAKALLTSCSQAQKAMDHLNQLGAFNAVPELEEVA
jgi:antirestriction protein ArdC